ncbi:MAG: enoyl-CoA hydratase-related protein [Acidimicrobiales bacterium]
MDFVTVDKSDGVAVITLDDPDRRNIASLPMSAELAMVFDEIESDDSLGAIVLTGAPPAFSAGADLDDLLAQGGREGLLAVYDGFLRVAHTPLPTIAAVNGAAVGAGMNFLLACDVILAGESARFDSRFLQIGIAPGGGHTWRMRNHTDLQAVKAMVLFSEVLSGREAERVGLAWRCVADDELLDHAVEMAKKAAAAPNLLVRRTKQIIDDTEDVHSSMAAVEHEIDTQVWSMGEPEFVALVSKLKSRISSTD